jgi:putative addiction module antidote
VRNRIEHAVSGASDPPAAGGGRPEACVGYNVRYNAPMFTAKVTTVGNSLGIVLPREILARLRVDKGDLLFLVESPLGFEMTPYEPGFAEQMQQAEQVMRADRNVLRLLAEQPLRLAAAPQQPPPDAEEPK